MDSKDIRDKLIELVEKAPAGGIFHDVQTETLNRNSFCLKTPREPIYTVTVTYGGALRSKS